MVTEKKTRTQNQRKLLPRTLIPAPKINDDASPNQQFPVIVQGNARLTKSILLKSSQTEQKTDYKY